ncbi:c-type cytochrome [Granulosicoccus antarcticus]|uniref:Cytochrome c5 n=1 Tax=Granulosicoccus antarcticus IMCC3135 TaxID=1192854 RepID=A0A2Z2P4A0_9GAMM|nr:c-type cytochrome [Granulosicoccus antarcticus]ASJ76250.1 Cytochrome c5 [Granulosicoccus antarcticus IMCC3135]
MSGATDSGMVKTMGVVVGALAVLLVVIMAAARMLGSGPDDPDDPLKRNALMDRIGPVATVRISADDLPAGTEVADAADAAPKTGEELVAGACAACHLAGVAGAPKEGDEAAWSVRREAGLDALVASVINGKGNMPPKGGSSYSDDEIKRSVQFLAMFEVEEPVAAPEAAPAAEGDAAATEEAPAADAVATEAPAEEATTEEAPAASEEPASDEASSDAAALVVGQVPDGLTDDVKASVDAMCTTCHLAGVGGAPKVGDTAAWQERADKGLAALTSSVINGMGVMPPRGASTLTDEQIPVAIQYLMSK